MAIYGQIHACESRKRGCFDVFSNLIELEKHFLNLIINSGYQSNIHTYSSVTGCTKRFTHSFFCSCQHITVEKNRESYECVLKTNWEFGNRYTVTTMIANIHLQVPIVPPIKTGCPVNYKTHEEVLHALTTSV